MALVLVSGPPVEPISTADAKSHLRVDISDDDTLIDALVVLARRQAERIGLHALITQTWDYSIDDWPAGEELLLPLPPLQSVTSVKYKDTDGVESTMDSADYIVDTAKKPGRIVLGYGKTWPSETLYPTSAITVRFVAGFGDAASDVPEDMVQAMKLMLGHWYENREATQAGSVLRVIPLAVTDLLWSYRAQALRFL